MSQPNRLTQGRVGPALLRFALPFLAASLLQQLYSTVDMMAVGRLSADAASALSAVSTSGQVVYTLTTIVMGLATGGTVLIGQYVGAGKQENVSRTIGTMFPLFGLVAVLIAAVLAVCSELIVSVMQVPAEAVVPARQYLLICAGGMIFVTGYNMASGILRGLGDSKTPMQLVAVACVINIVGDIILVGPMQLGAVGAAIATVTAQGFSCVLAIVALRVRSHVPFEWKRRNFALRREQAGLLLKLGVPVSMQDFFIGISFLLITTFVNRLGLDQSACVGVVSRVSTFGMLVSTAFMSAIAAMTAQNMGSGQDKRATESLRLGTLCSFAFSIVAVILVEVFPDPILSLFSNDSGVVAQGVLYIRSNILDCALVPFVFCLNGFFSGCGHTTFSMTNNLISTFGVRVAGTLLISMLPGANMFHIGLAAPAASAVQIVIEVVYFGSGRWRTNTILKDANPNAAR